MTTPRETFLDRVRQAVAAGNRAGVASHGPMDRSHGAKEGHLTGIGYQGAGPDPAARFIQEFQAAGGQCHRAGTLDEARRRILELVHSAGARKLLLGKSELLDRLEIRPALGQEGFDVSLEADLQEGASHAQERGNVKSVLFAADAGITGVDWLIAETGSIVATTRGGQARSLSLLPPVHIAVAETRQILPDLFDLFEVNGNPPACLTLITGPSKTGDIELRLVTGVHGPGEVHLVLMD